MVIPALSSKEAKEVEAFCKIFVTAINGGDDRRGLMLLKISEELERRGQYYSARLFAEIAWKYGY